MPDGLWSAEQFEYVYLSVRRLGVEQLHKTQGLVIARKTWPRRKVGASNVRFAAVKLSS